MRFQEAGWTMLTAFFSKLQQETLKEQGFCSTEVTGNAAKATLKGILYAAPFFIFLTGIYHIFLSHRATMPDMAGARMFLIPAAVWAISTLLHKRSMALAGPSLAKQGGIPFPSIKTAEFLPAPAALRWQGIPIWLESCCPPQYLAFPASCSLLFSPEPVPCWQWQ